MKKIYFDNSATTKIDPRVFKAMTPYLKDEYGNPGSIHSFGQTALAAVDEAREKIAKFFSCSNQEIIFTGCATESNNLAILGTVNYFLEQNKKVHIITLAIEHPSVLEVFKALKKKGQVEVDFAPVDANGIVKLEPLKNLIKENTVLVSIMYANNEVGSIQPIEQIGEIVKKERVKRGEKGLAIRFHVDAVQAINCLDCNVDKLGADFLGFSGHKIYAPKGVGALYIRRGIKIEPLCYGGHYEYNLRPGTLNVAAIVGLGKAIELIGEEKEADIEKLKKIKNKLIAEISKIDNIRFNGNADQQLPSLINVSFYKAEGESILMTLDMLGIAISTGSACSSGSLEPSHVLTAMGIKPEWSHGSIRISLGRFNSEDEVEYFISKLKFVVSKLRAMAP